MSEKLLPKDYEEGFLKGLQDALNERLGDMEKRAFDIDTLAEKFYDKFTNAVTNVIAAKTVQSVDNVVKALKGNKLPSRQAKFIENLIRKDEVLSKRPPERVISHYSTMYRVTPSLSLDENVVKSFLKESSAYDTLSPMTVKGLLDMEKLYVENKDKRTKSNMTYLGGK